MNQIARVFVVVNILLAAGFLFVASTFLGLNGDWKGQHGRLDAKYNQAIKSHELLINEKNKAIADKEAAEAKLREQNAGFTSQNSQLRSDIDKATADAKAKDTQIASANTNVASLTENLKRVQDQVAKLASDNTTLTAAVAEAQKNERAANEKLTKEHDDVVARDNTIKDMEKSGKTMMDEIHEKGLMLEFAKSMGFDFSAMVKMERIDAIVANADMGMKLVQINAGADQKVARGYVFDIVRGDHYIGRMKVDQVFDKSCAGTLTILKDGETVRAGDRATNTLR